MYPIWNDGALTFFEEVAQQEEQEENKNNNNKITIRDQFLIQKYYLLKVWSHYNPNTYNSGINCGSPTHILEIGYNP